MATAGERYEERTGNIWSYAHRGDMSGLRAALARDVSPDMINTAGWTPSHAAAAGGHTKALRLLARSGANLEIADRGGNLPAHQAAKNGHVHALRVLNELGADITKVRLSQSKGKAARDVLIDAYKKAGVTHGEEEDEENAPVGYARKQAKSTAFWGPRRTPISTKIKKKIIKENRLKKKEKKDSALNDTETRGSDILPEYNESKDGKDISKVDTKNELSYVETVRQVKREKKLRQKQKQGRKQQEAVDTTNDSTEDDTSDMSMIDSEEDENSDHLPETNGFAALNILDDSDTESSDEE